MGGKSNIEWTDATWNPVVGCSIVSPGCTNCYAMRQAHRLAANPETPHYRGTTETVNGKPVWTGKVAAAPDRVWEQPLHWAKPRRVFVNSMGDLFHEAIDDLDIARAFAVMACCSQHVFQVLTKRADRMRRFMIDPDTPRVIDAFIEEIAFERSDPHERLSDDLRVTAPDVLDDDWPLPNIWLGVSAERQSQLDERKPHLLATPAAVHFLSLEPLLGSISLGETELRLHHHLRAIWDRRPSKIDWVIAGGESGPGARPAHPDWFRSIRNQCYAARVPFFFKQWGAWSIIYDRDRDDPDWRDCPKAQNHSERYINLEGGFGFHGERVCFARRVGKTTAGRELDGRTHDAFPEVAAQ